MVDRIAVADLLQRKGEPGDRRKVLIELTPEAQELADDIYGEMAHATAPCIDSFSDCDLSTLVAFFDTSRRVNLEVASAVKERTGKRRASVRDRSSR